MRGRPHASEEQAAKPLNDATKHVAPRTLTSVEWANSRLIEGDVPEAVAAFERQDGPEHQVSSAGVVMATYEPAGELVTGTFALDA